jgi:hypothetical protein
MTGNRRLAWREAPPVHVRPDRYVVSLVPFDDARGRVWDLYVEAHGDRWKVHRGMSPEVRLTAAGEWSFDGGPETLHDWETATRLAATEAPRLVVSGMTAEDWLTRRR